MRHGKSGSGFIDMHWRSSTGHKWGLLQTSIGLRLLCPNVTNVLSHPNRSLPPEPESQPEDPVKATPDDLGGEFVAVNQIQLYTGVRNEAEITYASNWGPRVAGMKRGAWKRTVDTVA